MVVTRDGGRWAVSLNGFTEVFSLTEFQFGEHSMKIVLRWLDNNVNAFNFPELHACTRPNVATFMLCDCTHDLTMTITLTRPHLITIVKQFASL